MGGRKKGDGVLYMGMVDKAKGGEPRAFEGYEHF